MSESFQDFVWFKFISFGSLEFFVVDEKKLLWESYI